VAGQTHLYMVGYGRSGDGVSGYTTGASFTVKRHGENMVDAFYGQDDARKPAANEVFRFDFDGPDLSTNVMGGGTLGNEKETTLGGGDSGGPSFVLKDGANPALATSYLLAGVNTFTQGTTAPDFGSLGGGINVYSYRSWILGPHPTTNPSGGGGKAGPQSGKVNDSVVLSVLSREDNSAGLESASYFAAAPAVESYSSTLQVGSTPSAANHRLSTTPTLLAVADASAVQLVDRPTALGFSSGTGLGRGDRSIASESDDCSAVDTVLADWVSEASAPL